jgi:hypothetical protein
LSRKRATYEVAREREKPPQTRNAPTPLVVLKEVFDLLEEYGPVWYTEQLHNRIQAVLIANE